jgi:hypothetical protein
MKNSLALLLCALAFQVNAQSGATDERIRLLEAQILQLNGRVSALEGMLNQAKANQQPIVTGEGWKSKANWRKLKKGMSEDDVRALLGEPESVKAMTFTRWEYGRYGYVEFYDTRGVNGWGEPDGLD